MSKEMQKREVREFIIDRLAKSDEQRNISDEDNIIVAGIVDSLGIMHLISFLEENFSVNVPDEDILPENFESIDSIVRYIQSLE